MQMFILLVKAYITNKTIRSELVHTETKLYQDLHVYELYKKQHRRTANSLSLDEQQLVRLCYRAKTDDIEGDST